MRHLIPFASLAAALVVLAACPPGAAQDIVLDPCEPIVVVPEVTSTGALEEVRASLRLWNDLVGAKLSLDPIPGAPTLPVHFDEAPALMFGQYDPSRPAVFVNETLSADDRVIVLAHELGHAFGLEHVDAKERTSVMNDGNREVLPNASDKAAIAALWGECPKS